MLSSFKYMLYPAEKQEVRLRRTLASLCELYNELRSQKVSTYKEEKISLTKTDLRRMALEKRRSNEELKHIHSQVVQNVADRVSVAFKNFFEGRARFPRNKIHKKYRSFVYPQSGFNLIPFAMGHKLHLFGIGDVRAFIHRPMQGKVNRLSIKHEAGGWYAIFLIESEDAKAPNIDSTPQDRIRGADLGLERFVVLDDSQSVEYPGFLRQSEERIKHLQGHISHKLKNSRRRRALAFRLARLHLHIKRQREDYQNKLVSTLFNKDVDVLVLEKLAVESMLKNHSLAKSISDASFSRFLAKCIYKATMLGKQVVLVDPWGTSQFCFNCLEWVPKDLGEREHNCPKCGIKLSRDENSARLIKRLGIRSCPPSDGGLSPAELRPLPSLRGMASRSAEAGSQHLDVGGRHSFRIP